MASMVSISPSILVMALDSTRRFMISGACLFLPQPPTNRVETVLSFVGLDPN